MEYLTETQHNLVMDILMRHLMELPENHESVSDLTTAISVIDELAIELGWEEN